MVSKGLRTLKPKTHCVERNKLQQDEMGAINPINCVLEAKKWRRYSDLGTPARKKRKSEEKEGSNASEK